MTDTVDLKMLEGQAERAVAAAMAKGADACDVVVAHGQSLSIAVREGKSENTNRSEGNGVSLRVFVGDKVASVSSDQLSEPELLAERAVSMAKVSSPDPFAGLAPKEKLIDGSEIERRLADLSLFDETQVEVSKLEEAARAAEDAGLSVEGVAKSMGSNAGWGVSGFVLATSEGFSGSYQRSRHSVSAAFVAGEGTAMERDYEFSQSVHLKELADPAHVGRTAGERVIKRVKPRQPKTQKVPIVFDRRVSMGLLGSMMSAINGSSIARKTSFLRDMMGKQIASSGVTVVDDPLIPHGLGSRPFDGEGAVNSRIEFIQDGILQDWVLDGATARELSLESNGRATRSGSGISPSTTNCFMAAGDISFDEMISNVGTGLYLTETIGHGINLVTGDYSKGASGYWIENGEIAYPVAEITVAGNLKEMFLNVTPANDLEFKYSTNAPTLLVEGMTVGGK